MFSVKFILMVLLFFSFLLVGCSQSDDELDVLRVAYCPSMAVHLEKLDDFDNLELIEVDNTRIALNLLSSGTVDVAFVGILAYPDELLEEIEVLVLFDRLTIISNQRGIIEETVLSEQLIYTYLDVPDSFSHLNLVVVDKEDALSAARLGGFALISWSDFDESDESISLVNVMQGIEKVELYRNPSFYYSEEFEEQVLMIKKSMMKINS
jgi:hypothetical protein